MASASRWMECSFFVSSLVLVACTTEIPSSGTVGSSTLAATKPYPPNPATGAVPASNVDPATIDVLVLYTRTAEYNLRLGDTTGHDPDTDPDLAIGEISQAITYMNTALTSSGAHVSINLLGPTCIQSDDESWGGTPPCDDPVPSEILAMGSVPGETRENLATNAAIRSLRDQHNADVVMLLSHSGFVSGIAGWPEQFGTAYDYDAFGIVFIGNTMTEGDDRTFAHELGHILGANHDWWQESERLGMFREGDDEFAPSVEHFHGYVFVDEWDPVTGGTNLARWEWDWIGPSLSSDASVASGAGTAQDVEIADVDRDGDNDVVSVTSGARMEVSLDDGDGNLGAPTAYVIEDTTGHGLALAYLDGDNYVDALVVGNRYLSVFINDGDGTFTRTQSIDGGVSVDFRDIEAIDLTGDGELDAILVDDANDAYVTVANSLGTFGSIGAGTALTDTVPSPINGSVTALEVADLDLDGDDDFVTAAGATLVLYVNDGDGNFSPDYSHAGTGNIVDIALGDVDQLNGPDVIAARDNEFAQVFLNTFTNPLLNAQAPFAIGAAAYEGVDVGEINGDGYLDLVMVGGTNVRVFTNDQFGGFSLATSATATDARDVSFSPKANHLSTSFYTIMAYPDHCAYEGRTCRAIPYFANPNINEALSAQPLGVSASAWTSPPADYYSYCLGSAPNKRFIDDVGVCPADVVSVFNEMAPFVEAYRSASGPNGTADNLVLNQTGLSVELSWDDNVTNESGFRIYRTLDDGLNWAYLASVGANVTTYVDPIRTAFRIDDLENGSDTQMPFTYRVQPYNAGGMRTYAEAAIVIEHGCDSIEEDFATLLTSQLSVSPWTNDTDGGEAWQVAAVDGTCTSLSDPETVPADFGTDPALASLCTNGESGSAIVTFTGLLKEGFVCFSHWSRALLQMQQDGAWSDSIANMGWSIGSERVAVPVAGGLRTITFELLIQFGVDGQVYIDDLDVPLSNCASSEWNDEGACTPCTLCDDGQIEVTACSAASDTVCEGEDENSDGEDPADAGPADAGAPADASPTDAGATDGGVAGESSSGGGGCAVGSRHSSGPPGWWLVAAAGVLWIRRRSIGRRR